MSEIAFRNQKGTLMQSTNTKAKQVDGIGKRIHCNDGTANAFFIYSTMCRPGLGLSLTWSLPALFFALAWLSPHCMGFAFAVPWLCLCLKKPRNPENIPDSLRRTHDVLVGNKGGTDFQLSHKHTQTHKLTHTNLHGTHTFPNCSSLTVAI